MRDVILHGDALETLKSLPAESVHCVVTSPPYWGLRDYGTGTWEGGDAECDHKRLGPVDNLAAQSRDGYKDGFRHGQGDTDHANEPYRDICGKCGARRIDKQLGLEPTPEEYIDNMVRIFGAVRRVLRDDGTLWMNMGDGFEDKQLVGMPWRLALALQADGWYLRSDIIWAKPNPMPESVTDRPTKSHEYVFLMSKQPRYFYDADAVREEFLEASLKTDRVHSGESKRDTLGKLAATTPVGRTCGVHPAGRNKRTVWTIATQPMPEAHFATFPEKLVEPCIRAGTSEHGVCADCGAPWRRVVEITGGPPKGDHRKHMDDPGWKSAHETGTVAGAMLSQVYAKYGYPERKTTGWQPGCDCGTDPVACTVLDPFMGAGTVALVAKKLNRYYIGIELNQEYINIATDRLQQMSLFLGV